MNGKGTRRAPRKEVAGFSPALACSPQRPPHSICSPSPFINIAIRIGVGRVEARPSASMSRHGVAYKMRRAWTRSAAYIMLNAMTSRAGS